MIIFVLFIGGRYIYDKYSDSSMIENFPGFRTPANKGYEGLQPDDRAVLNGEEFDDEIDTKASSTPKDRKMVLEDSDEDDDDQV